MAEDTTAAKAKKEPTVYTPVTMSDGRVVQFAGKKRLLKEVIVAGDQVSVRFDFVNGEIRTLDVGNSPLLFEFAGHGASQKVGDETAGVTSVDDMVVAVDAIIDQLNKGEWGVARAAGDSFSGASVVIKAIFEVKSKEGALIGEDKHPITAQDVKNFLAKKLEADKAKGGTLTRKQLYDSFRKPGTATAEVIDRLEKESLSKTAVDSVALLEEIS
jgi:hypothetical protein